MNCDFCNNQIVPGTELEYNGFYFCNKLHRYSWMNQNNKTGGGILPHKDDLLKKNKRMVNRKKILIAIVVVIFISVGSIIGSMMTMEFLGNSVDSQLLLIASEFNKNCPVMVDKDTRLDNALAGLNKEITYNYTLINVTINQINIKELESYLRPRLLNNIKTNEQMKYMRDNSVTLIYHYKDKNGVSVLNINIKPEDYL